MTVPSGQSAAARPKRAAANDERVTWVDWLVLALAVVSVVLLIVEQTFSMWFEAHPGWYRALIWTDIGICGVFAIEFLSRMRKADDKWAYVKSRWYDVLGMIPVSHPLFRGFRLIRILRIGVITSRFVRATNRTFGEMAFEVALRRFSTVVVEVVSDAILIRSLDTLEPLFAKTRFADGIAEAVDARRDEIRVLVQRNLERVPGGSRMLRLKVAREVAAAIEDAAVDAVLETLKSDELNEVFQDATVNFLEELRVQVIALNQTDLMRSGPGLAAAGGSPPAGADAPVAAGAASMSSSGAAPAPGLSAAPAPVAAAAVAPHAPGAPAPDVSAAPGAQPAQPSWVPPPGWVPPADWVPPPGWAPPSDWNPPESWTPPSKGRLRRLKGLLRRKRPAGG